MLAWSRVLGQDGHSNKNLEQRGVLSCCEHKALNRKCPRTRYLRGFPFSDLLPPEVSRTSQDSTISWGAGLQHMNLWGTFHIQAKTHFNQLILISVGRTKCINYILLDCSLVEKKIYALLISMIRFSKMTRKFF